MAGRGGRRIRGGCCGCVCAAGRYSPDANRSSSRGGGPGGGRRGGTPSLPRGTGGRPSRGRGPRRSNGPGRSGGQRRSGRGSTTGRGGGPGSGGPIGLTGVGDAGIDVITGGRRACSVSGVAQRGRNLA